MTNDIPEEVLAAAIARAKDQYRDAVAILKSVAEDDVQSFAVIVQHCQVVPVIHALATMLMAGLWQLGDMNLDNVFARIELMQQQLQGGAQ